MDSDSEEVNIIEELDKFAIYGNLKMVKKISENTKPTENTFLNAVKSKCLDLVKFLLSIKCSYNPRKCCYYCANYNRNAILKLLHSNGCIIPEKTMDIASKVGNFEMVQFLASIGINGYNPLRYASINGYLNIIIYLLEDCKFVYGEFIMDEAITNSHLHIIKYLVSKGYPIRYYSVEILQRQREVNEYLIDIIQKQKLREQIEYTKLQLKL